MATLGLKGFLSIMVLIFCTIPMIKASEDIPSTQKQNITSITQGPSQDCVGFREILQYLESLNTTVTAQNARLSNLENILRSTIIENQANRLETSNFEILNSSNVENNLGMEIVHVSQDPTGKLGNQSLENAQVESSSSTHEEIIWGAAGEDQSIESKMLRSPRALLFTGENLTGNSEQYDFKNPTFKGGCYNLQKKEGKIKSVDTGGTCVRIFSGQNCKIWSQAIYPGTDNTVNPKIRGVMSVGPCVKNEFEHVLQEPWNSTHVLMQKIPSKVQSYANMPDLIPDYFTYSGTTTVFFNSIPIYAYRFGFEDRLEALASSFHIRHLRTPDEAEANKISGSKHVFYGDLPLNEETDEPGFACPLELGGPADKRYNVFAQNRIQAAKYRETIVPQVKNFLTANPTKYVRLTLNFFYENATTARPSGMYYLMFKDGLNEITYGYFPN